jgi:hypothetical protein
MGKMKEKFLLDPLSAAHELTVQTLEKADWTFPRMRRALEDQYGLRHGTLGGV